jgi:hypothetical protein
MPPIYPPFLTPKGGLIPSIKFSPLKVEKMFIKFFGKIDPLFKNDLYI